MLRIAENQLIVPRPEKLPDTTKPNKEVKPEADRWVLDDGVEVRRRFEISRDRRD